MTSSPDIPRVKAPAGAPIPDMVQAEILNRFASAGVVIFEDLLAPSLVAQLHAAYMSASKSYHRDTTFDDALTVGDKRTMITVEVAGAFNDPQVYANPTAFPFINTLLGEDVVLGSFVAVTSLPGSGDQQLHLDTPPLFGDDAVGASVPPYCLTLVVPLVDMNARNGSTAFYPGSHRGVTDGAPDAARIAPEVPVGSALLFDARVWHGGTPNRSTAPRPVLYCTYQRSWFRDAVNFGRQVPLDIGSDELARVPKAHRHLFDWTMEPLT